MTVASGRLSLEEFLELPEEKPALELIDGVVKQKVSPQGQHGGIQSILATMINAFAWHKQLAWAFTETRSRFRRDSLVPDVSVYRWDRIPETPDGEVANRFDVPPDLGVEILSPGQHRQEQLDRCQRFIDSGVQIALLVDPRTRTVVLFRPGEQPITLRGADRIDLDAVLPGFDLTVQSLFGTLRLRPPRNT